MDFTPDLLDDFITRKVAFFLGAGISAGVHTRTGESVKTWAEFLIETSKKTGQDELISEVKEFLDRKDYLFACELLKDHFADEWETILKSEYEKIGEITELQKAVLELKQRIIVTTNFDLFIERNWDLINTDATHNLQIKNGISADCFSVFRDEKDYLIKIHASINAPDTIIFSLSDYASKAHANWQYSTFIETLLNTHTVLFIGFSMDDATITNILAVYAKKYPRSRPHYAFLPDYTSDRKIKIMKSHRKLYILPYSSKDNHQELLVLLNELKQEIEKRKRLLLIDKKSI
ncbi:hypothetical protein BIU88_04195 [Chlorobaculum limnaeum]|uniref:Uncharacterized protein n=1 Tax=Chlorobaculum limnaeum TaxID=274537 RepID=A0A1D8D000_CHLLM|nr:SIR2 family protein [Chlorobaculum limnaeum]AOS83413.1 hypothetical protein BIU88_04195 [Chlorobaculum limnaeum]